MKVARWRFLLGANRYARHSGILVQFEPGALAGFLLEWRPDPASAAERLGRLQSLVPELGASAHVSPAWLVNVRWPALQLLVATCDALLRNFCIRPTPGHPVRTGPSRIQVFVPCDDPQLGVRAAALALDCIASLQPAPGDPWVRDVADLRRAHAEFRAAARRSGLNPNAMLIARAAVRRDIPFYRIDGSSRLVQLGQGIHRRWIDGAVVQGSGEVGDLISRDKVQAASLLESVGLPTTRPRAVQTLAQALEAADALGYPVVLKPRFGGRGIAVSTGLRSAAEVEWAFARATQRHPLALIERHVAGFDHRLLVIDGRFVAAARRSAPHVTGDGRSCVRELIEALNLARRSGECDDLPAEGIEVEIDDEVVRMVARAGLRLDDVPSAGQTLTLRGNSNVSTGGNSVDITAQVHADNRVLAERAARLLALRVAGIDYQTTDIGRSWRELPGAILEVNSGPGLSVHLSGSDETDGPARAVALMFPPPGNGRIPLAGITGSVGKTTTSRMLAAILGAAGHVVALATTQGAWIGDASVRTGDSAAGTAGVRLLRDPSVTAGVFEMARGALIAEGTGVDRVDVAAVLNVLDNHVGLDGVPDRAGMARVKRRVAESARDRVVLNADDPLCLAMREGLTARVCLVSQHADCPEGLRHLADGGVFAHPELREGTAWLVLREGTRTIGEMPAASIPATWGGAFRPAIANALFAMTLAHAMLVDFAAIRRALEAFDSGLASNPGRMNFVSGLPHALLLTWADGPEALAELASFIRVGGFPDRRTLVFGAVGLPSDDFIVESGRAVAGAFTRYVCCDMEEDRHARAPGEVAHLLARGLRDAGVPDSAIVVEPASRQAWRRGLLEARAGELLVIESYRHVRVMDDVQALIARRHSRA